MPKLPYLTLILSSLIYASLSLSERSCAVAFAEERFVGDGERYLSITAALRDAESGDVITIRAGLYEETLETEAAGVTLRADPVGDEVVVTTPGRVLRISHSETTIEGLTLDGQFGDRDLVQIRAEGDNATLRSVEIRNSGRDCVDMGRASDVLIEDSLIHHCLRSSAPNCADPSCREDAHGVTGSPRANVTLRRTEIHTVSGDAIQFDPNRSDPGWTGLVIEGCRLWVQPLPEAVGGYAAGVTPGENALDTKTSNGEMRPAELLIRDTTAYGWRNGLITNMSAFNLKENIDVTVDRVTVYDSEIAFRLRGATEFRPRGAQVGISNTVIYNVDKAIRYEDEIGIVRLDHVTLGDGIRRPLDEASATGRIRARNVLFLGDILPDELQDSSNLAVDPTAFVAVSDHDYHLTSDAAAIDIGESLAMVLIDRDGNLRPQGSGWDIGAYERLCESPCGTPSPDDTAPREDAALDRDVPLDEDDMGPLDMTINRVFEEGDDRVDADLDHEAPDGDVDQTSAPDMMSSRLNDEGGCRSSPRVRSSHDLFWVLISLWILTQAGFPRRAF